MKVHRLLLSLLLTSCLCWGANAQDAWEQLADADGYRSSQGVIQAQTEPQSASDVLNTAEAFAGIPYQWAGTSPETGFDCSGYIYEVLRLNGYQVPRMADQQFHQTERVAFEDLLPGDLVFFTTYLPGPSHAGFYLGDGHFIHASSAGEAVVVSQMETGYYNERFLGGGRPDGWLSGVQSGNSSASSNESEQRPAPTFEQHAQEPIWVEPEVESELSEQKSPLYRVEPSVAYFKPEISRAGIRNTRVDNSRPELETRSDEVALKLELVFGEMFAVGQLYVDEFRNSLSQAFEGMAYTLNRL